MILYHMNSYQILLHSIQHFEKKKKIQLKIVATSFRYKFLSYPRMMFNISDKIPSKKKKNDSIEII